MNWRTYGGTIISSLSSSPLWRPCFSIILPFGGFLDESAESAGDSRSQDNDHDEQGRRY
jgi:hypothetical protein